MSVKVWQTRDYVWWYQVTDENGNEVYTGGPYWTEKEAKLGAYYWAKKDGRTITFI